MAHIADGGGGSDNPYIRQTLANISTGWLGPSAPLEVELDDMADFANSMVEVQKFIEEHKSYLDPMDTFLGQSWDAYALGEARWAHARFAHSRAELQQYLANLSMGVMNVGMAAQTIADIYRNADEFAAADVNAVRWAFADPSAPRPDNLPPWLAKAKTYSESLPVPPGADETTLTTAWGEPVRTVQPDGSVTLTFTNPQDSRHYITITTFESPRANYGLAFSYSTYTVTTIHTADGTEMVTRSDSVVQGYGNRMTTTTTTQTDGKITGIQEHTVQTDDQGHLLGEEVIERNADGQPLSTQVLQTDESGQTLTTTVHPKSADEEPVVRTIQIGAQTDSSGFVNPVPAAAAMQERQNR